MLTATMPLSQPSPADQDPPPPQPALPGTNVVCRVIRSEELFAGGKEIWIEHGTEMYRLRITSRGKLILTK